MNDIDHLLPSRPHGLSRSRRGLLLGAASFGLTACASESLKLISSTVNSGSGGRYPLSDSQIAAIPYASLGLRVGSSAGVVMILASVDGDRLHWASSDRVVLVTQRGRLVKTIGMPRDLLTTRFTEADPLPLAARGDPAAGESRISRIIDLRPKDDFSVPVDSRCTLDGEETVSILGVSRTLIRVSEKVVVRKWRWSTENLFWLDPVSHMVWKSRQQFCPDVAPLTMEVLRPAI